MSHILMIEDDVRLAGMVRDYLGQSGFTVDHVEDGGQALLALRRKTYDLALLDLMLPDGSGLDLFRRIRGLPDSSGRLPVIMLTAKGDPMDRVVGLEIGADDYLPKPFEPRELVARIRAVLRRGQGDSGESVALSFGSLEIDKASRLVRLAGVEKPMTSRQFALLLALAERPGRVLSREQLMEMATGQPQKYDPALDRSVDVHIGRIRALIEEDPKDPRRILTIRNAGYVFARKQD
jgi:DNA-binding response OmpR family regulator